MRKIIFVVLFFIASNPEAQRLWISPSTNPIVCNNKANKIGDPVEAKLL